MYIHIVATQTIKEFAMINSNINCVTSDEDPVAYEYEDNLIANTCDTGRISVAIDSAAVDNVIHPGELPPTVQINPNHENKHFVGANNSRIENFGTCTTKGVLQEDD